MVVARRTLILIIVAGVVALGGALAYFGLPPQNKTARTIEPRQQTVPQHATPTPTATSAPTASSAPSAPAEVAKSAPVQPELRFDIVRVTPSGETVIAGRAAPEAAVELLVNGQTYEKTKADAAGDFVMTPAPLSPGNHELLLRQSVPGQNTGQQQGAESRQSVTVVVAVDAKSAPVVALAEPGRPTEVLSSPEMTVSAPVADQSAAVHQETAPVPPAQQAQTQIPVPAKEAEVATEQPALAPTDEKTVASGPVSIAAVEAEAGSLFVSGKAPAGTLVRLYLNDSYLASGKASPEGKLAFAIRSGVGEGDYRVRLDAVESDDSGKVLSRAEAAFDMNAQDASQLQAGQDPSAQTSAGTADNSAVVVVPEVRTARVEKGDSLWRISRRIYGHGIRYTVIYGANQDQIRDPHRIYPGQVFVLPVNEPHAP